MAQVAVPSSDGVNIQCDSDVPQHARLLFLFVHGVASHQGTGRHLKAAVRKAGHGFVGMDLRGHGRSDGAPMYVESFDTYAHDLKAVIAAMSEKHPLCKIVLVGNSIGSLIILRELDEDPHIRISGAVLVSPAVRLLHHVPLHRRMIGRFFNVLPVLKAFKWPNLLRPELSMRDTKEQEWVRGDPLCHSFMTTRMYFAMLDEMKWARAHHFHIAVPLLALTPGVDNIIYLDTMLEFVRQLAVDGNDLTHHHYDTHYHGLLQDIGREKVIDSIMRWAKKRV